MLSQPVPSGGVSPNKENLQSWFDAGVTCVGMGSKLITREILENKNFKDLEKLVNRTLKTIEEVRN